MRNFELSCVKLLTESVLNSRFHAIKVLLLNFDMIPDMVLHLSDLFKEKKLLG